MAVLITTFAKRFKRFGDQILLDRRPTEFSLTTYQNNRLLRIPRPQTVSRCQTRDRLLLDLDWAKDYQDQDDDVRE